MRLSILTMITKPDERQDMWREALKNYSALADEVIVVDGSIDRPICEYNDPKVKIVGLTWPDDWDYSELPKHLNYGKKFCTGDWILKLDIDQFIHEKDFTRLRDFIEKSDGGIRLLKMIKVNFSVGMKFYSKGSQPIIFRNDSDIGFGYIKNFPEGDLCIPMKVLDDSGEVWIGETMPAESSGIHYWNFSYTFKTEEVSKAHIARIAKAYRNYFKSSSMGSDDEEAWSIFLQGVYAKISRSTSVATLDQIPESLREAIKNLKPEQKAYNFWGRVNI